MITLDLHCYIINEGSHFSVSLELVEKSRNSMSYFHQAYIMFTCVCIFHCFFKQTEWWLYWKITFFWWKNNVTWHIVMFFSKLRDRLFDTSHILLAQNMSFLMTFFIHSFSNVLFYLNPGPSSMDLNIWTKVVIFCCI